MGLVQRLQPLASFGLPYAMKHCRGLLKQASARSGAQNLAEGSCGTTLQLWPHKVSPGRVERNTIILQTIDTIFDAQAVLAGLNASTHRCCYRLEGKVGPPPLLRRVMQSMVLQ